jgi:hypothetical protein
MGTPRSGYRRSDLVPWHLHDVVRQFRPAVDLRVGDVQDVQ